MLARDVDGPGNASGHLRFEREQRHRVAGDSIVAPIGELSFAGHEHLLRAGFRRQPTTPSLPVSVR